MLRRTFRQTTLLTVFCVSVLAGLGAARRIAFSEPLPLVLIALCAVLFFRKKNVVSVSVLCICGLGFGLWRGNVFMAHEARYHNLFKQKIVLTARAETDAIYGETKQLNFDVSRIEIESPIPQSLPGKIRVEGVGEPMVYRGDVLRISGSMSRTRGGNQARMSFASFQLVRHDGTLIDLLRRNFMAALGSVLPEPHASFGAGILIGARSTIPKETNEQLSVTGLTHIVAVSGYNLTIIVVAVRRLMGKRSKFQSTMVAALLMVTFVLITGFSASIVRAALVSALSLLAWYYGRSFKPVLLISFGAALTAAWNPFYIWSDLGWYLSFIAFFGVLMLAPLLLALVSKREEPKLLAALLTETIAAQVVTLPLIMYIFGRVSLIGLVANVLVVPLVPLSMLLTLVAGLAGVVVAPIAGWFAWPARILLVYMLDITAILSRVPHASAEQYISVWTMIGLYVLLLAFLLLLWFRTRGKRVQNLLE